MSYISDSIIRFSKLPASIKDPLGTPDMAQTIQDIEQEYGVDLNLLIILVAIDELRVQDVSEFLQKQQGVGADKAAAVQHELVHKVFKVFISGDLEWLLLTLGGIKQILSSHLRDMLQAEDDLKWEFNSKIGFMLVVGPETGEDRGEVTIPTDRDEQGDDASPLRDEFVDILEQSKEVLSKQPIEVRGRRVDATVGNWIKAFLAYERNRQLGSLALSKFVTTTPGAKALSAEERDRLRQILSLYQTIRTFPDSLFGIPVNEWEFVSVTGKVLQRQLEPPRESLADRAGAQEVGGQFNFEKIMSPWLQSFEYNERMSHIVRRHSLTEKQEQLCKQIVEEMIKQQRLFDQLPQVLQDKLQINAEAVTLLVRDIIGHIIKPVGQYIDGYSARLIREWGGVSDDFPEPDSIVTILNQIAALVKQQQSSTREQELQQEVAAQAQADLAAKAQESQQVAVELREQLKQYYKDVQSDALKKARQDFGALVSDDDAFTTKFYAAINDRAQHEVIGALWVMASQGTLLSLLERDKKISGLFAKHLTNKYDDTIAQHFETHQSDAAYVSYFLQHLLNDTLKMDPQKSAALAIHLLNEESAATGKEPLMISYGDIQSQRFVWKQVKKQGHKLTF